MHISNTYDLHRYICEVEGLIRASDLDIRISTDFFEYRRYRMGQADRAPIPAMFDVGATFIAPNTGFWIKVSDETGQIVHSQAVRLMALNQETLFEHISGARLIYAPPELSEVADFKFAGPTTTHSISGNVSYHGEAWTEPRLRRVNRGALSLIFGRLGVAAARMFWPNLDYCFAFMSTSNVLRGLHARAGFANIESCSWTAPGGRNLREWFVWMDRNAIDDMVSFPPQELNLKDRVTHQDVA